MRCRVNRRATHRGQVDHQCVVPDAEAARVVSSHADGEIKVLFGGEADAGDDI